MIKIVAEIGCNHGGNFETAHEMISVAARIGKADVVKFQKRTNRELLSSEQFDAPHPVAEHAFGTSYGQHREALEFSVEQHRRLKEHCEREGVTYASSVWDMTSARELAALSPAFLKIPSATNLHFELHHWLCENFRGDIHLSTGMTTPDEIERIVAFYTQRKRAKDLVLYACTAGYPIKFEEICLLEIRRLQERFGAEVKAIGFSGHHLGIAADVAALTLGAQWIERHFTLDRTWRGTDQAASLEPDGLRRLCRDLRNVTKALALKEEPLLPVEQAQRNKLKYPETHPTSLSYVRTE